MSFRRAPDFWTGDGLIARMLQPLAWAYASATAARQAWTSPWHAPIPVICVGNLTVGGTGKTPVVMSLATRLKERGCAVHLLSRGYGGRLPGPVAVDCTRHDAGAVGDEPLLLAELAPAWIARDRVAGARAAAAAGAEVLVLDDGFQDPALAKNLSLVVVDGDYRFGNGRVLPAGPLREPLTAGLARADAVVLMEAADAAPSGAAPLATEKPLLRARLEPAIDPELRARRIVAFAGIGRPEKFFTMLERHGLEIIARHAFPDHHAYRVAELARLAKEAETAGARLVTTRKDATRLPQDWSKAARVVSIPVTVRWRDEEALSRLIDRVLDRHRHG